jgi:hypothetical protein
MIREGDADGIFEPCSNRSMLRTFDRHKGTEEIIPYI